MIPGKKGSFLAFFIVLPFQRKIAASLSAAFSHVPRVSPALFRMQSGSYAKAIQQNLIHTENQCVATLLVSIKTFFDYEKKIIQYHIDIKQIILIAHVEDNACF